MSSNESDDDSDFGFDFKSQIIDNDALKKLISTDKSDWNDHIPRNNNSETNEMVVCEDDGGMSDDSNKTVDFHFETFQAEAKKFASDKHRAGKLSFSYRSR